MKPIFNKIAVIGTGLMGCSFALACREYEVSNLVLGYSHDEQEIRDLSSSNIFDIAGTNFMEIVADADLVVVATPLGVYKSLSEELGEYAKSRAVIMDLGSVKYRPSKELLKSLYKHQKPFLVPAHPIAGTEKSGFDSAFSTLYEGKKIILTPFEFTHKEAMKKVERLWKKIGAYTEIMDIKKHDKIYAKTSHNAQIINYIYTLSCTNILRDSNFKIDDNFRAFIRLSASNPTMWSDICAQNCTNITHALENFLKHITYIRGIIDIRNIDGLDVLRNKSINKNNQLFDGNSSIKIANPDIYRDIIPHLIAVAMVLDIKKSEHNYIRGAGMRSLIFPINYSISREDIISNDVISVLNEIIKTTCSLINMLENKQYEQLHQQFSYAKNIYAQIM